jgi:RHS repeat-associated protein
VEGGNARLKVNSLTNPKHSSLKTTSRNFNMLNMAFKKRLSRRNRRDNFTVKELDAETGLYYYGARYLDPKTGRWLSGDPAMGEYFPVAPVNDEAKKHNGNLPGQGGVFNYVNLHAYHYAENNPVKLVDPDGRDDDYYDFNGKYLRTVVSDTNNVYACEITNNGIYTVLVGTREEFNRVVALIYAEASHTDIAEEKAMGEVIFNRMIESGLSINGVLDHERARFDGLESDDYREAIRALNQHAFTDPTILLVGRNKAKALRDATAGAIDGLLGGGKTGAYFWTASNYNRGPAYDKIRTIGGSSFWKYNEKWKKENGHVKNWP